MMVHVIRHVRCILDDLRLRCRKLIHVFCKDMWVSFISFPFLFIFIHAYSFIHYFPLFVFHVSIYTNLAFLRSPSILLFFRKAPLVVNLMYWLARHFGKMEWITWYGAFILNKHKPCFNLTWRFFFFFWQHGTGHGFGAFLSVHEGPHGFSSNTPLEPGHVITNEPGFCKFPFHLEIYIYILFICFFFLKIWMVNGVCG